MKERFVCGKCGQDFDTEKECDEHERRCDRIGALERKVADLERRLATAEMLLSARAVPEYGWTTTVSVPLRRRRRR